MTDTEEVATKAAFAAHYFLMVEHPLGSAIVALPKKQSSPDKEAACELFHGSTVKLSA